MCVFVLKHGNSFISDRDPTLVDVINQVKLTHLSRFNGQGLSYSWSAPTSKVFYVYCWLRLAGKDSLHKLLGMMVYVLPFDESLNSQDVSFHADAFALGCNADSLLCLNCLLDAL